MSKNVNKIPSSTAASCQLAVKRTLFLLILLLEGAFFCPISTFFTLPEKGGGGGGGGGDGKNRNAGKGGREEGRKKVAALSLSFSFYFLLLCVLPLTILFVVPASVQYYTGTIVVDFFSKLLLSRPK